MRTALMPDSEEIEPTGTESSKAKLSERGANSRQNFNFSANSNSVVQKFGKLIPKSQLSASDLKEIEGASKKISERLNIQKDTFVK